MTSANVMLSSNHWAFLAGGGSDCLEGILDIGPARSEGCILFVGRGGSCGVKSSARVTARSGSCGTRLGADGGGAG